MNSFNKIHESFARQTFLNSLGATLESVEEGRVIITAPFQHTLTQQHGYLHAGVMTTLADVACGYAALSMASGDSEVLSVEFKINFLKPALTSKIIAIGQVLQAGRKLTICEGTVYDVTKEKVLAKMIATMIIVKIESSAG